MEVEMRLRTILAALAVFLAVPALPVVSPSVAQAQTVAYAAAGTTNLRAGPGTNYRVTGKVYGGTQVYVHRSQSGWYYVTAAGQQGWMAGSRLRFGYASAPAPAPFYIPLPGFRFGDFDRDRRRDPRWDRRDRRERDEDWRWRRDDRGAWGRPGD
jgi:uncharacterized protein YraI